LVDRGLTPVYRENRYYFFPQTSGISLIFKITETNFKN